MARSVGKFVVLAGPDGSGKTTLALRMVDDLAGSARESLHLHWRPGLLPRAGLFAGSEGGDPSTPHAQSAHGRALSWGILFYYWLDFLLGLWIRVCPVLSRGGVVVMERGWWDFAVDPRRYRLNVPARLVELLGRLLPRPDVVMILEARPEILTARKGELPSEELSHQLRRWREVRLPPHTRRVFLDASLHLQELFIEASRQAR